MAMQQDVTRTGTSPCFRPRRIGHTNIFVGDLDRSMAFYENVLGIKEAWRRANICAGFVNNGNTHHDVGMVDIVNPQFHDQKPDLFHVAFELENQVDLAIGYKQAVVDDQPIRFTYDHAISQSLYTTDPDGTLVEIYADTEWRWWEDRYLNRPADQMPNKTWKPGDTPPSSQIHYEPNPTFKRVDNAVFHPLKITHIALVADNYEAVYDYYTDYVGLALMLGGRDQRFASLGGTLGGRDLSLFRATDQRPGGFHHHGFVVEDEADLEKSIAWARTEGIEIEVDIDHPSRRSVMVRDPDGLRCQLYSPRDGAMGDPNDIDDDSLIYLM
jgi:catechol 2,3-dioxygenase